MSIDETNGEDNGKAGSGMNGGSVIGDNLKRSNSAVHHDGKGKDVIPLYRNCTPLLYWDWLFRFWIYFDTPAHWISWYAAAGFFFGAQLFIIGSFAEIAPAVINAQVVGNCMGDINDWLVAFCYFAGDTLWFVAVCFQMIEALNPGYDARIFEWQEAGCKGSKPRYRWFGVALRNLDWWGALCYTVGVGMYWVAALSTMINDCPNSTLAPLVYLWLIDYFYLIAGILFLLAGAFYCMHEISPWLYPAIFCPLNRRHAKSLKWWALNIYFWGGVGYCMGGIQLYWFSPFNTTETLDIYNIVTGIGFGGGSVCFFLGSTLLLARQAAYLFNLRKAALAAAQARGRCRPSYGEIGRLDPTIYKGQVQPPLNARRADNTV